MSTIKVRHWSFTKVKPPFPGTEPVVFLNGFIPGKPEEMSLGGVVSMNGNLVETANHLYELGEISPQFAQDHIDNELEVPTAEEFAEYFNMRNSRMGD
jgi:hypothetical protein